MTYFRMSCLKLALISVRPNLFIFIFRETVLWSWLQATLVSDVETTHIVGKKYKSLLLSYSASCLLSMQTLVLHLPYFSCLNEAIIGKIFIKRGNCVAGNSTERTGTNDAAQRRYRTGFRRMAAQS